MNRSLENDIEMFSSLNNTRESINLVSKRHEHQNRSITPIDEKSPIQRSQLKKSKNRNRFQNSFQSKNPTIETPIYKQRQIDILK